MRKLLMTTILSGLLIAQAAVAEIPKGGWVFDSSPDYPGFTRLIIEEKKASFPAN